MHGQQLIGLTIFPISFIGILCNGLVLSVILRIRSLSPPFAFLTGCLAFFDVTFNFLYFGLTAPMIVFDIKVLKRYSSIFVTILMILYDVAMETHLIISLNRFFAVFTPIAYRKMFSLPVTKLYIIILLFLSITIYISYILTGCRMYYDNDLWLSWLIDYAKNLSISIFDGIVDVVTITKVIVTRNQMKTQKSPAVRKREIDFLKQTCFRGFIALFTIGIYYFVPEYVSNNYIVFMLTNFLWGSLSTIDGIVALIYNSEIRSALFGKKKDVKTSSTGITTRNV